MIELANALHAEIEAAAARFHAMSESDISRVRGAGKWSKKEILGHLIDSACNNHQRFIRAQSENPFVWPGYEQDRWVCMHRYRERSWAELVDLWIALNRHVAHVIETVPLDRLETSCIIGGNDPASLEWWMRDYLRHLKHHLEQLMAE